MRVPFTYIVRNLFARRLTTALTAGGMALVVYVFATVLMLSAGLRATLVATGQDDNVVGVFDAGGTGFDSEIWGDAEQMMQVFRRTNFSALIFKLGDSERFDAVKQAIESDPRLTLDAKRETRFYADQSEALATFINYLRTTISVIFSIGAIIGAMITTYASLASRTAEI